MPPRYVPSCCFAFVAGLTTARCRRWCGACTGGMILDGGTESGVMAMVGAAIQYAPEKTVRVLGVCPKGLAGIPDHPWPSPDCTPLEPNHASFMLVPSKEVGVCCAAGVSVGRGGNLTDVSVQWGGETSTMFATISFLSSRIPAVALVANGGVISRKEVCERSQRGACTAAAMAAPASDDGWLRACRCCLARDTRYL
jgi:hypothetical protein